MIKYLFLKDKIRYTRISEFISRTMEDFDNDSMVTVEGILNADRYAREKVYSLSNK